MTKEEYVEQKTDMYKNYCKEQHREADIKILQELQKQWAFDYEMDKLYVQKRWEDM